MYQLPLKTWADHVHLPRCYDMGRCVGRLAHDGRFWAIAAAIILTVFIITLAYRTRPGG